MRVEGSQRRRKAGLEGRRSDRESQRGWGRWRVFQPRLAPCYTVVPRLTVMSPSGGGNLPFKTRDRSSERLGVYADFHLSDVSISMTVMAHM